MFGHTAIYSPEPTHDASMGLRGIAIRPRRCSSGFLCIPCARDRGLGWYSTVNGRPRGSAPRARVVDGGAGRAGRVRRCGRARVMSRVVVVVGVGGAVAASAVRGDDDDDG